MSCDTVEKPVPSEAFSKTPKRNAALHAQGGRHPRPAALLWSLDCSAHCTGFDAP